MIKLRAPESVVDIERHNHEQIEMLNQRGGRTLSVVDLVQAGTLSVEMAAYAMRAMAEGASLLTGARPGGAGKTTLLAALLQLLPPNTRIVTVDSPGVIADALGRPAEPECFLAHEIGAGHWYGYIWGRAVADFLALIEGPRRVASCLHADTLDELAAILGSPPLGVSREALGRVGLILFIHLSQGRWGARRRVAALHEADGRGGHRLVFWWDEPSDAFERASPLRDAAGLKRYSDFIERIVSSGEGSAEAVRNKARAFYRNA